MVQHFKRLARYLEGKSLAREISSNDSWFDDGHQRDMNPVVEGSSSESQQRENPADESEVQQLKEIVAAQLTFVLCIDWAKAC